MMSPAMTPIPPIRSARAARAVPSLVRAALALIGLALALALAPASGADARQPAAAQPARATAIFAGGCFWCTEADFEKVPGVISAESGYTGGTQANPTYEQVGAGRTGHVEAVRVVYDPRRVSYRQLVDHFWLTIDPTDVGGQFCDRGPTYVPAVFATASQRPIAEASRAAAARKLKQGRMLAQVRPAARFWPAEAYHQDFYKKNPLRYRVYRQGCGRDARLARIWGEK